MNELLSYLELGVHHIWALDAYDHLIFVMSLVLAYTWKDRRAVVLLLTAFTLGHGLSMFIVLQTQLEVNAPLVEQLIPWTILIAAVYHMLAKQKQNYLVYALILTFGCIHGLAYGSGLAELLSGVLDPLQPILGFNVGVELAQLSVALLVLLLMSGLSRLITARQLQLVRYCIFGIIICLSLYLITF